MKGTADLSKLNDHDVRGGTLRDPAEAAGHVVVNGNPSGRGPRSRWRDWYALNLHTLHRTLNSMKHLDVVAAVIRSNHQILCVQRGTNRHQYIAEKWEFPGGKVEQGEHHADALIREISEELCLSISIVGYFLRVEHTYPDFRITMHTYHCRLLSQHAELRLREHVDSKWLFPNDAAFLALDWAAADVPIVQALHRNAALVESAK